MSTKRLQLSRHNSSVRIFAFSPSVAAEASPVATNDASVAASGASVAADKGNSHCSEYLCMFTIDNPTLTFRQQVEELLSLCAHIKQTNFEGQLSDLNTARIAFKRYYLSDAANQVDELRAITGDEDCAVSMVQQPPLSGSKVGMWVYFMTNTLNHKIDDHLYSIAHDGYEELWSTQNTASGSDSYAQTFSILSTYAGRLRSQGCTLRDNCVRTWLYVNDIDNQYAGVVRARNDVFDHEGLTTDTHFIASTGIGGRDMKHEVYCKMNAVAIKGITPAQVHYLYAVDHLNRTSDYGVRFERGTYVDFASRRRVYISGTASIDNHGHILYEGDIRRQVHRMWENIAALLAEAGCTFDNVAEFSVYLRDIADYQVVAQMYKEQFPNTPYIILHAPVCRPGWLIESECIALKEL